jgi:L-ribulose-5-phosphate 3-epimerase
VRRVVFTTCIFFESCTFNKKLFMSVLRLAASFVFILFIACNSPKQAKDSVASDDTASFNPPLGVALWTFHVVDFPTSLKQVDSAGLKLIEPNTFHATGPEFKDTVLGQLSSSGLEKLNQYINELKLEVGSVYLGGGNTVEAWKKDFETAKQLNARFVTAEPPVNMWDVVDSLAGVYGMKVAIHEHWKGTSPYWHPDSVLAAIKDHPNFGACADLGHWPKSGINPLEAVKKLEGHIIGIHLKDIAEYNNTKITDVAIGKGVVDFPAIFAELKRQNFNGNIYIERDTQEPGGNLQSVIAAANYYNDQMSKLKD